MAIKAIWVNGPLVRRRLLEMGVSEREFARQVNVTSTAIRSITSRSQISTGYALSDLNRMVSLLGVTWGDLFDQSNRRTDDQPDGHLAASDDAATLIALLLPQKRAHEPERLATALNWTLERLMEATKHSESILPSIGLRLHRTFGGITLRTFDERTSDASATLCQLRDAEEGLLPNTAKVLYEAWAGTLSEQEDRNDHQVQLGRLHAIGALTDSRAVGKSRHSVTDDVQFCLDF